MQKVYVGYPCGGSVLSVFSECLLEMQRFELLNGYQGYEAIGFKPLIGLYVQDNRNQLVDRAREAGADWLLQLDSDTTFAPELLRIMMRFADPQHRPIITGVYSNIGDVRRLGQFDVVNCLYAENPDGTYSYVFPPDTMQPFQVDACGAAVLLTHLSVYDRLEPPYFWQAWFTMSDGGQQLMNEDLAFCRIVRQAGFPIWCDPVAEVAHWKTVPLLPSQFRQQYDEAKRQMEEMKKTST